LLCAFFLSVGVNAQAPQLKPAPLYNQCQSLGAGSESDDAIARALAALKEADPKVRIEAAQGLSATCHKRATEPLVALLSDPDLAVRIAAIEALGKLGDVDSVRELNEFVDDKDWRIRMALVGSLASFKTFQARNLVVNGIANPNGADISDIDDMRVRCTAILTANQLTDVIHSRKSILFLHVLLQSRHEPIRLMAEQAMFALKRTRNGPTELVAILKISTSPELRRWSAEWIGKLGIENGRDLLTETSEKDPDQRVKKAATEALKALDNSKSR
jgi:HEAT repeat protein